MLEVCLDGHTVISCTKALPPAPLEASISFGPAALDVTEVRVWGAYRSDNDLVQFQRQCLDTVLSSELRGEAWKKVKIRAAAGVASDQGDNFGLWDISNLPQTGGGRSRKTVEDQAGQVQTVQSSWPTGFGGFDSPSVGVWPQAADAGAFADGAGFDGSWPGFDPGTQGTGTKQSASEEMNPTPRASSPRLSKAGQGFVSPKSPIPPAASSPTPWKSIAPPTASSPPVSHQESFKPSTATPTATPATPATLPLVGRLMQGILAKKEGRRGSESSG